ncbi:methyl-accepting chemotaxis protein [Halorientalis salina]|uniref:methyl-accepting chemotaxis protein n=1 Tax=Halorientalis salina TaxID=2932266 RepID=UPI002022A1EF|nr:methyl-accepting chemotaxis protein [Halorientalis salina]
MSHAVFETYQDLLWGTMDLLGVTESVERKIVAAVAIQFSISLGQAVLPFVLSGTIRIVLVASLMLAATVAFVNTLLITRVDFVDPLVRLDEAATSIAAGDLDAEVSRLDQRDEVGRLTNAFVSMSEYLGTVDRQADALARQDFEDPALDEDVPGEFGESMATMADSLQEYTTELESMTTELEQRSQNLESMADAFGDVTEEARDGDLTATLDLDADNDRHRTVVENYNELLGTLGATISDVAEFAHSVADASNDLEISMDEINVASEEVADSTDEISQGAASQSEQLQTIATEMNTLSATVEEIAASADEVATTAEAAAERGRSGRDAAVDAIDELDDVEERIGRTADEVEALVERIDEIDQIVSFIEEIAEETNMLALNASIEAARTGADGDGFAVVADEVKNLADETRASADEVSELIDEIQAESREAVDGVRAMNEQVSGSITTIEETLRDFEDIVEVVGDLNTSVQEISTATDEQAETTQQVVRMVDDVASISEQTTAEAENVAAAAQEQTASVSNAVEQVRTLNADAAELQGLVERFQIPSDDDGATVITDRPDPATPRSDD